MSIFSAGANLPSSETVELADPFTVRLHPRDADVFIGYSTTQGQISPINHYFGSAFFQTLAQYLQEYYKSCPLDQIYTMVTDVVADKNHQTRRNKEYKHVPQSLSTLRQTVFFTNDPQLRVCYIHYD